jgi:phage shock protein A
MSTVKLSINVNSVTPALILRLETINEQLKVKIQENERQISQLKSLLNMLPQSQQAASICN